MTRAAQERGLRRWRACGVPSLTSGHHAPYALVDERLCAEDDGECEPFGGIGMLALNGPDALRVFDTNAVGIIRVTEAALPLGERPAARRPARTGAP
jgi:hypothetical protein